MMLQRLILILTIAMVAGCGVDPTAQPVPQPTVTIPPTETQEAEENAVADDASPGEVLFYQFVDEAGFACISCHYLTTDDRLLGPGLLSIEDRFETYDIEVENIEAYIRQSIEDPSAFIVPNEAPFPDNLMPRTYGEIFTDDEIDSLVDFILSS